MKFIFQSLLISSWASGFILPPRSFNIIHPKREKKGMKMKIYCGLFAYVDSTNLNLRLFHSILFHALLVHGCVRSLKPQHSQSWWKLCLWNLINLMFNNDINDNGKFESHQRCSQQISHKFSVFLPQKWRCVKKTAKRARKAPPF